VLHVPDQLAIAPDFGARVRAARGYLNLSQADFGKVIAMSEGYVKGVERGDGKADIAIRGLIERMVELTGFPESFFLASDRPAIERIRDVEAQLSQLDEQVRLMRVETAARDAEVLQRLSEALPTTPRSQRRPPR
jgi:transcriptional regulator with XRE-family HTH domain